MRKLLLGFGLIFGTLAFGAVTEPDRALVERARNLLSNGGFESSTATWSATGGTVASVTAAANVGLGNAALSWDASAASQVLSNTAVTIPAGLYAANGLARCMFKTTATDYVLQAYNGSSILASATIPASTQYQQYGVNFPFPSSGSVSLRVVSASDAAVIYMDDCYVGPAANLQSVNQASLYATMKVTGCSGSFTRSSATTSYADFTPPASGCSYATTGPAEAPTTFLPAIRLKNLPPGRYKFEYEGYIGATNSTTIGCLFRFSDGTNASDSEAYIYNNTNIYTPNMSGFIEYTTAQSDITVRVQSRAESGSTQSCATTGVTSSPGVIRVYRFPSTSELAYRPDQVAWRVDANISGANVSLGTAAVSSYTGAQSASLSLTQNSGSIATQIGCDSTNPPTGTTCAVGNEQPDISFTVPSAGSVLACASFSHSLTLAATGAAQTAFQIVETAINSQTIIQEGKSRLTHYQDNAAVAAAKGYSVPFRVCGVFNFASAGQKMLRLFFEQEIVVPSILGSSILADASAAIGQRDIHWEVYPITQSIPAPLLVGSVTSNSTGLERVERAYVHNGSNSNCTTSPCSGVSQSGSWLTSVTRTGTGDYTLNIASGIFSTTPFCICNARIDGISAAYGCRATILGSTATAVGLSLADMADTRRDGLFQVICMGPR